MNYSLGNMLNGGDSLNPDGLALDLQFATDKTLTARNGPTPVFTRASGATQVGASGLIEYAPENLVLQSQNQAAANWSLLNSATKSANSSIGVDGTTSATTVTFSASNVSLIFSSVTLPAVENSPTTLSVWVSSPTSKKFRLAIFGASQVYSADITPTSSLARYQLTVPNINTASPSVVIANETAGGVGSIIVWGFQFERSSLARTYLPTTTAAVYGARFDHDPITLACKGLLIEESRTNLCNQSGNVGVWIGTFTNSGSTTAPDGTSAGYLAGIGTGSCQTLVTASVTGLHTLSVYLKRNNTDWARLQCVQGANVNSVNFWVNLSTGAVGALGIAAGTPTSLSAQVTPAGDGWYRCSVTASYPATNYLYLSVLSATADNSTTRVAGSIYGVWGAQIEAGAFPTSYIPTTTASVVRSADVCSISGANFTSFYNNAAGTLVSESMIANLTGNNRGIAQIDSGTTDNVIRHNYSLSDGGFTSNLRANTDTPTVFNVVVGAASVIQKRAIAYEGTSFASSTNGGSVATVTRTFPVGLNTLRIGSLIAGGFVLNGHIAAVRFYKKRLPNAKLQALTA